MDELASRKQYIIIPYGGIIYIVTLIVLGCSRKVVTICNIVMVHDSRPFHIIPSLKLNEARRDADRNETTKLLFTFHF